MTKSGKDEISKIITPNTEHTITAQANEGWHFVEWTLNNVSISDKEVTTINPSEAGNYVAKFEKIPVYTLEVKAEPVEGGSVYINTEGQTSTTVPQNTEVTLNATPNEGWHFVEWTLNGSRVSEELSVKVTPKANSTYIANFEKIPVYNISVGAWPTEGGTVYIDTENQTTISVTQGTEITLNAKPNDGWHFVEWTFNGAQIPGGASLKATPEGDGTYEAKFAENPSYTIEVEADPEEGGIVYIGSEKNVTSKKIAPETYITINAESTTGWHFVKWTLNGSSTSDKPSFTFKPTENSTYVAIFEKDPIYYSLDVEVLPKGSGTVSIEAEKVTDNLYLENSNITAKATAAEGYEFNNWLLNNKIVSESESYSFEIAQNSVLTAVFSKMEAPTRKITFSSAQPSKGTVEVEGFTGKNEIESSQTVVLKAIPANSFTSFAYWTKNGQPIDGDATYTYTDPEDADFIAYFSTAYPVTFETPSNGSLKVADEDGTVLISGDIVAENSNIVITATPDNGYKLTSLIININGSEELIDQSLWAVSVTSPISIKASFEKIHPDRTIKYKANDSKKGSVIAVEFPENPAQVYTDKDVTLKAVPKTEFDRFDYWTLNNVKIEGTEEFIYSDPENADFIAYFSTAYPVTFDTPINGTLKITDDKGNIITSGDLVAENTEIEITATPAEGYQFKSLIINGIEQPKSLTVWTETVTAKMDIQVSFEKVIPSGRTITFKADNPSKGTVIAVEFPENSNQVNTSDAVTLRATPKTEFDHFEYWTLNGKKIDGTEEFVYSDPEDADFVAYFTSAYPIKFETPTNGTLKVTDDKGNILTSGDSVEENTEIVITATPDEGYRLSALIINDEEKPLDQAQWSASVTSPINIKASFETIPLAGRTITFKADNPSKGSVAAIEFPDNPTQVITSDAVILRATPKTEFDHFDYWTLNGNKIDAGEEITYTDPEDADFVAYFSTAYPVTFDTLINGSLKVTDEYGYVLRSGDTVGENSNIEITTTPDEGYKLASLLINDSEQPIDKNVLTVSVTSPISIKASFEEILKGRNIKYKANDSKKGTVVAVEFPKHPAQVYTEIAVTLRATPKTEFDHFDYWTLNGNKIDAGEEITYTDPEDADFVAFFSTAYPIKFETPLNGSLKVNDEDGNVLKSGDTVAENSNIEIMVTPDEGYKLAYLLINDSGQPIDKNVLTVSVSSPINIKASFEKILKGRTITFKSNNPSKGSVTAVDFPNDPAQVITSDAVTLRATPKTEYDHFDYWTLNGNKIDAGEEITYTDPEDADFIAYFSTAFPVTFDTLINGSLKVTDENGNVLKSGDTVAENSNIEIMVTPDEGYQLASLLINDSGQPIDKNVLTVSVSLPINIKASFEEILKGRTITFKSNNPSKGSVTAVDFPNDPAQVITSDAVTLRATPKTEYDHFDYWTLNGEKVDGTEEYVYSDPEDADFIAYFTSAYPITFTSPANGTFIIKDAAGNELKSGDIINDGENIYIQLIPDDGYRVTAVKANDINLTFSSESFEYKVSGPLNIVGSVEAASIGTCFVSVISSDVNLGTVYIDSPGISSKTVVKRTEVILHAEPAFGCKFEGWRYQNQSVFLTADPIITREITTETHYVGVFNYIIQTPRQVTVLSSNTSKGTVMIKDEDSNSITTQKYLTLIATPVSDNDLFVDWTDQNGKILSTNAEFVYDKEAPATITANFISIYELTYSVSGDEADNVKISLINLDNSSILTSGTVPDFSTALNDGTRLKLSIEAPEHFEVSELVIDGTDVTDDFYENDCSYTFVVSRNTAISIVIAPKRHSISINSHAYGTVKVYKEIDSNGKGLGSPLLHGDRAHYGTKLYIFPEAVESSFELQSISINGVEKTAQEGKEYIEHLVDGDVVITPVFASVTAIDSIEADGGTDEIEKVFDLTGRYLGNKLPTVPGIYIVKTKTKTHKVKIQ